MALDTDPIEAAHTVDPLAERAMSDEERRDLEFAREWKPTVGPLRFNPAVPERLAQIRADREAHDATIRAAAERSLASRNGATEPPPDDEPPDHLASWQRVDLGPYVRGEVKPITPSLLRRQDHVALLYAGRVNGVHGDSGSGKSWVAEITTAQEISDGHHVIGVDLEDPDANTIRERLQLLGVTDDGILDQLHYYGPDDAFGRDAVELIGTEATACGATGIVIDSLGEAFGLEGINESHDEEVGPWLRRVARPLADLGPAVLLLDHSTKAGDNPLHASGSKRKRAAITGASYLLETPEPLTRESGGRLTLTTAKDRHGWHRQRARAAEIVFAQYPDGGMTHHVWPPSATSTTSADARLDVVARAAIRATRDADRPISRNELEGLMSVKASATLKRGAIDRAVGLGAIRTEAGPRNATLHIYVHDLDTEPTS